MSKRTLWDYRELIEEKLDWDYAEDFILALHQRDIEVAKATEEHIIKLLEKRLSMLKLDGSTLPFGEYELRLLFAERCIELSLAIALIKGEQK